jgi:hypothetical protein
VADDNQFLPRAQGDPVKGEHEQRYGELLDEREVTNRADKQRAEAQADEPEDYPGDSGEQAKQALERKGALGSLKQAEKPLDKAAVQPASTAVKEQKEQEKQQDKS